MNTTTRIALAIALSTLPAVAGEAPLGFKGKTYSTRSLPAELSPVQKDAVQRFAEWAETAEYRMDFDAQGRLLLVTPKGRSRLADTLKLIGKTETWFDTVLPAPPRAVPSTAPRATTPTPAPAPSGKPIPEDPESVPSKVAWSLATEGQGGPATWSTSWGTGSIEPDSQTAVLVIPKNAEDYGSLLDLLAKEREYLAEWMGVARKHTGFTVEDPLTGAFVENAAGQEEWDPEHEVINRVAQLLTLRRFGQQPNWVVQGIAWEAEMANDGQLYCFPYRREFVLAAEHGAWPAEAKNLVKDLGGKPVEMASLCAWKRGTWEAKTAKLAWGVARHFLGQTPGRFSAALEEMRMLRDEEEPQIDRREHVERIPNYELPPDVIESVLVARFGKDALKDATTSIRNGRVTVTKEPKPERVGNRKP